MIHAYLPNEISLCSAYLLRYADLTTKQMPILCPSGNMLTQILYSSEAISPGSFEIQFEANNMLITSLALTNGATGEAFLPSNIVLPIATGISLKYIKQIGKIANLQMTILFKELC